MSESISNRFDRHLHVFHVLQDNYNALMDKSIKTYSMDEIISVAREAEQPKFRGKQLYEWLHKHHAMTYDEMHNLPKAFREYLKDNYPLAAPIVLDRQVSRDGTHKYILEFQDGRVVETVGIPSADGHRLTVCVSSQVGCPMACQFCATGKEGFTRNLTSDEITDQVVIVSRDFQMTVTNVVVMGQGEPFLNYENLIQALKELNNPDSFNIGARHITVSTCGIFDGIEQFSKEPFQFTLAISLHSAIQKTRNTLMPRVINQPLTALKEQLKRYIESTNRRVTFEYLLINGINDSDKHLEALLLFTQDLLCHVNLLTLNEVDNSPFKPSPKGTLDKWEKHLSKQGTETTVRKSRGSDIDGACGQLKNKRK